MTSFRVILQSLTTAMRMQVQSPHLLTPATKLGQGYVFIGVCDSVHRGGVPDTPQSRYSPPKQTPPGADPPGADLPGSRHLPKQTPPGADSPPRTRYTPQIRYPPTPGTPPPGPGTLPWSRYTPRPPGADTPPRRRACWEIRSTRGRYASYWNAILLRIWSEKFGKTY